MRVVIAAVALAISLAAAVSPRNTQHATQVQSPGLQGTEDDCESNKAARDCSMHYKCGWCGGQCHLKANASTVCPPCLRYTEESACRESMPRDSPDDWRYCKWSHELQACFADAAAYCAAFNDAPTKCAAANPVIATCGTCGKGKCSASGRDCPACDTYATDAECSGASAGAGRRCIWANAACYGTRSDACDTARTAAACGKLHDICAWCGTTGGQLAEKS